MISIRNLWHHYGATPTLRGIDLEVQNGELLTLMGPNGMGKSTLLSLVAGIHSPFKGDIFINGKKRRGSIEEECAIRRETFYLPHEICAPFNMTGREYLLAVGRAYGHSEESVFEHAEKLIQLYNLEKVIDNNFRHYSTGQTKKLGLCSALISKAKTLILDEPLSGGLDSSGLFTTQQILKSLAADKDCTVLMAVPIPELVEKFSDRMAIIKDGKLQSCGTIAQLKASHGQQKSLAHILESILQPQSQKHLNNYIHGNTR